MSHARANMPGDEPPLVWTEDFSVGVPQLDEDHRLLFELVDSLAAAPLPVAARQVRQVLDALAEYTARHFAREEAHQAAIGFPELAEHRAHHQHLIERLASFRARYVADPRRVEMAELRQFLRRWLINHVLHEDMRYRWYADGDALDD